VRSLGCSAPPRAALDGAALDLATAAAR